MTVIFFGSSAFSIPALRSISPSVINVVTKKTKPKGRGYLLEDNEVKREALALGLPVTEIDSFRDEEARRIADLRADLFVVASFGLIIPKWFLDSPAIGAINVHPSLLPLYRGPSPMQWAIWQGEKATGITIISMSEKMDGGDILFQEQTAIEPDEDAAVLSQRLSHRAAEILVPIVQDAEARGMPQGIPQDDEKATYTPIITKEMGKIDWHAGSTDIVRQVRALVQWPTAYTSIEGKMVKVFKARAGAFTATQGAPGTILTTSLQGIEVASGAGSVIVEEVQMENRKRMAASDFARGYRQIIEKQFR